MQHPSPTIPCRGGPLDGANIPCNGDPGEIVEYALEEMERWEISGTTNTLRKNCTAKPLKGIYRYAREHDHFQFVAQVRSRE